MKVLVTGATGFIGNYVIKSLLQQGVEVIASSSNFERAKQCSWFNEVANYLPLDFTILDSTIDYFNYFEKPDVLIHLAWEGLPNYKNSFHVDVNLPRHIFFLENLIHSGLRHVCVTGTCFEYGKQEGCLTELSDSLPDNPYAIAKNLLRIHIENLAKQKGCIFQWVRLFYMYGKGQASNAILMQLQHAIETNQKVFNMSGGMQTRDYLPITDVANNIIKVAMQRKVTGIINCSSNKPISIKDLVLEYLEKNQSSIELNLGYFPYTDFEPMHFWGDNAKLLSIQ